MKSHRIRFGMTVASLGVLALGIGSVAFRAQADEWDKKTILTVDQPIQVTDTYLDPGTYVFKLLNSSSDRHIVQIYDADQKHLINTVMAIPNYRIQPTGGSRFTFWETPPGTARAMRAWFYPGDNFGQEFRYPKNLRQLAVVSTAQVLQPAPAPVPEPPAAAPEPAPVYVAPEPTPVPEAANVETHQVETHQEDTVIIAQNTPPPPPPAPEVTPAPVPPPPPVEELPKTATPYPLIGLGGLLSLGVYFLLRLARTA